MMNFVTGIKSLQAKHKLPLLIMCLVMSETQIFAQDRGYIYDWLQQNPQYYEIWKSPEEMYRPQREAAEKKLKDEMEAKLEELKEAAADKEKFLKLFETYAPELKKGSFGEHLPGVLEKFHTTQLEKGFESYSQAATFREEYLERLRQLLENRDADLFSMTVRANGHFLRLYGPKDLNATVEMIQGMILQYRSFMQNPQVMKMPDKSRRETYEMGFWHIMQNSLNVLYRLPSLEKERVKDTYGKLVTILDETMADEHILEGRKQSDLAEFANYVRGFGRPDLALALIKKHMGGKPEEKFHPRLLEVLFFLHQNQLADRKKALHYMNLIAQSDNPEPGWQRHPKALEYIGQNYYEKLPLSDDQLKRFCEGHNNEMRKNSNNIGDIL